MSRQGLLIDYDYCTGCHSCEVACKQEHDYPVGKGGINLVEILTEMPDKSYRIDYLPFTTMYCDLCAARTAKGERPACVKHCQASTMTYGDVADLAKIMEEKPHCVLFTPR
jgi:Fe-S-cluster-containing dehydrogenase component